MTALLTLWIMLATMVSVFAQVDELKSSADVAYNEADYQKAVELYEQLIAQEYASAELYYNLGNAYFKAGQIAPSILNYERALKLAPNDEDIRFNLKLANMSIKDKVEVIPELFFVTWWKNAFTIFSTDGWAWNAVIAFVLALLGFLMFRSVNDEAMKRLLFYTALVALLWAGFSVYAAEKNYQHIMNDDRAVIFSSTVTAKSAPDQKGKDLFVIHEGLVVTVSDELNGWLRIKLTNGDVGWVPEATVVRI